MLQIVIFASVFCGVKMLFYLCCVKGRKTHYTTTTKAR